MPQTLASTDQSSRIRGFVVALVIAAIAWGGEEAYAQGRDGLLNGAMIGAAVGAGTGVVVTHSLRDSELGFGQYVRGALVFAAVGAGAGLAADALLIRVSARPIERRGRIAISPVVRRDLASLAVTWQW